MAGIIALFFIVTLAIALVIASARKNGEPPSTPRFFARLIVAWILLVMVGALLALGACAMIFDAMFPGRGCINC